MKNTHYINIAIFILFFGIALVDALQRKEWLVVLLFLALGALSIWADTRKD